MTPAPSVGPGRGRGLRRTVRAAAAAGTAVLALGALPAGAPAQWRVAAWDGGGLELGGYVRALTAVHDAGFEPPDALDAARTTAVGGQVVRLKWAARGGAGEGWVLEVHQRLQARLASSGGGPGTSVVGFGVSAVPGRSVELETTLVDEERARVWHDVDRLAVTVFTGPADVTVGRQAITWGLSALFPVADLWARFSPFELDTEEKPGIDAVRALSYPREGLELDGVVADRGSLGELSAGVRAAWALPWGDLYLAAGKFWREAVTLAGGALLLDEVRLRLEAALPWELEDEDGDGETGPDAPRATAGLDWIRGDWTVTAEAHFNGIGVPADRYAALLASDPRIARGETYFLGRWYAGAAGTRRVGDRLSLGASVLANLGDPSASLSPLFSWDLGQNARLSLGGLVGLGERPAFTSVPGGGVLPVLGSEFGTYGSMGWSRISLYF